MGNPSVRAVTLMVLGMVAATTSSRTSGIRCLLSDGEGPPGALDQCSGDPQSVKLWAANITRFAQRHAHCSSRKRALLMMTARWSSSCPELSSFRGHSRIGGCARQDAAAKEQHH